MARSYGVIKGEVWEPGSDFRDLSPLAQWAYFMLLSQPQITNVGLLTYSPGKWARLANGLTRDVVEACIDELAAGWFVLVDRDTGELLIRTYIRHDRVWKQPKLVISARRQIREVESDEIRDHLVNRHPWLMNEWTRGAIEAHEGALEQGVSQPLTIGVSQGVEDATLTDQGMQDAGPRLQAQQQDQELRTTNLDHTDFAAAALEPPRQAAIKAAADRYGAHLDIVEREAQRIPVELFDDVTERTQTAVEAGTARKPAALFVDLLKRARREADKRAATDAARTPLEDALFDARSYARGDHPWAVAAELLDRKLNRLGVENGSRGAILDAARAAYQAESARGETP